MVKKETKQSPKKSKIDLSKVQSIVKVTKDRIEAKQDKEYYFEHQDNGVTKFVKKRYVLGEDGEPLEQHWVEYVDLKNYNKILNRFNDNLNKLKDAIKQLTPIVKRIEKSLGDWDADKYKHAKEMNDKFELYHKYKNQLETVELQKVDALKWKDVYKEANDSK